MAASRFSGIYPQKWGQLLVLFAVCVVLFVVNLGQWDLWNPDEPRYAQVSREMVQGGDWILMHLNGKTYAEKPPFFFWGIAFSSFLMNGFNSFSARFPSALFGTLTVFLAFLIGKKLYDSRTGFFSGLVLATSIEFAYLSTRANIDATLTFFTTASFLCFIYWYFDRQKVALYGFYIAMAFATLTKGPVGFVLPLLVSLVFLAVQRDWAVLRKMKLIPGFLLLAIIVLAWYVPAVLRGGQAYLNYTLFHQTIDRYTEGWSHAKPVYYYLMNFPADFLPWTLFLPAGLLLLYRKGRSEKPKQSLFLFLWFAVIFVFFSFSKGKRELYLLPLYPAVSLIVGKMWYDFVSASMDGVKQEWISVPLYGLIAVALLGGLAIPVVLWIKLRPYFIYGFPMTLLLVGGSVAQFILFRKKKFITVFFVIVAIIGAGFFYTLRVVFPLVNPYKSARLLSQEVLSQIKNNEKVAFYGSFKTAPYNFYMGMVPIMEIERKDDLYRFLHSQERVFCLIPYRDYVSFLKRPDRPSMELVTRRAVGGSDMAVISNR